MTERGADDEGVIAMADLGWHEDELRRLLARWLPPVRGPSGAQLLAMTRAPEQARLREEGGSDAVDAADR